MYFAANALRIQCIQRVHTHSHNNICKEQIVLVNEYVSTEYGIFGALKAKMRRDFVNLDVDVDMSLWISYALQSQNATYYY